MRAPPQVRAAASMERQWRVFDQQHRGFIDEDDFRAGCERLGLTLTNMRLMQVAPARHCFWFRV